MHLPHRPPRAPPEVLARPGAAGLLGVEQRGLVLHVGERPGDVGVVPDQHAGQAGHGDPGDGEARFTTTAGDRPVIDRGVLRYR